MTASGPVATCFKFRENLRDAADSAQRNFPEGFGRFAPGDFARFLDHSRSSLLEVKDGLESGVERGYWSAADADSADRLANRAMKALSGLQRYLRSPQAKRNADRARAQYLAGRRVRKVSAERHEPDEP
jgi:four helix bundle protein